MSSGKNGGAGIVVGSFQTGRVSQGIESLTVMVRWVNEHGFNRNYKGSETEGCRSSSGFWRILSKSQMEERRMTVVESSSSMGKK